MNRLMMRIGGARFGAMIVTTLVLVVTLLIACGDRRVSWQGRVLIFALRGYRGWSAHQAHDLPRQRHAYDTFGKTLPPASDVPIARLTVAHCPAEWALPPHGPTDRAVLYLHGGGYNQGSLISHRALVTRIARASGIRVLSLEYRLAPEHPFPAALDDAVAAYQWVLAQGFAPAHLVVAGDSAGGGLAVAMLVALRDQGIALPAGAALLSPWTDLSDPGGTWERDAPADLLLTPEGLHTMARDYLGDRNLTTPLASPIYADPACIATTPRASGRCRVNSRKYRCIRCPRGHDGG